MGYAISLGLFLGLTISHVILHEISHEESPVCALCDCICLLCYVSREDVPLCAYNTIYIYIGIYLYYIYIIFQPSMKGVITSHFIPQKCIHYF